MKTTNILALLALLGSVSCLNYITQREHFILREFAAHWLSISIKWVDKHGYRDYTPTRPQVPETSDSPQTPNTLFPEIKYIATGVGKWKIVHKKIVLSEKLTGNLPESITIDFGFQNPVSGQPTAAKKTVLFLQGLDGGEETGDTVSYQLNIPDLYELCTTCRYIGNIEDQGLYIPILKKHVQNIFSRFSHFEPKSIVGQMKIRLKVINLTYAGSEVRFAETSDRAPLNDTEPEMDPEEFKRQAENMLLDDQSPGVEGESHYGLLDDIYRQSEKTLPQIDLTEVDSRRLQLNSFLENFKDKLEETIQNQIEKLSVSEKIAAKKQIGSMDSDEDHSLII